MFPFFPFLVLLKMWTVVLQREGWDRDSKEGIESIWSHSLKSSFVPWRTHPPLRGPSLRMNGSKSCFKSFILSVVYVILCHSIYIVQYSPLLQFHAHPCTEAPDKDHGIQICINVSYFMWPLVIPYFLIFQNLQSKRNFLGKKVVLTMHSLNVSNFQVYSSLSTWLCFALFSTLN